MPILSDPGLWDRIAAHDFERPHALTFAQRLARDHGWTLPYARVAIDEYRRFAYLAVTGPEATPSEQVDEVWHAHLVYSRDYWDIWCAHALQARLHHDPTQGGPAERYRFRAQYASTLARYEAAFGPPPVPFWPGTQERFGPPRYRIVDQGRTMLLPRPAFLQRRMP